MAGILEKMGLVRTEEVPLVTPLGNIVPQVEPENTPEIDASQVSYEDVIHSIYQQGGVEDTHSIFKIKAYIDILPPETLRQLPLAAPPLRNRLTLTSLRLPLPRQTPAVQLLTCLWMSGWVGSPSLMPTRA